MKQKRITKIISIILGSLGLVFIACMMFIAYIMTSTDNSDTKIDTIVTGEMVEAEINKYRADQGLSSLETSIELCSNISSRAFQKANNPDQPAHIGFEEWHEEKAPDWNIGELILTSHGKLLPEAVIYGWVQSPSHKIILEKPEMTHICTYVLNASEDKPQVVVAELGFKEE